MNNDLEPSKIPRMSVLERNNLIGYTQEKVIYYQTDNMFEVHKGDRRIKMTPEQFSRYSEHDEGKCCLDCYWCNEKMIDEDDVGHVPLYVKELELIENFKETVSYPYYIENYHMRIMVRKAGRFSFDAHAGQLRKYTNEPYIVHPQAVAQIVRSVEHTYEMIAAALLHDVVEDTNVTSEQIHKEFGSVIGILVDWLTDVSKPEDGNREVRKRIDREHIAKSPPEAKTIKLADLIDNTKTIKERDPNFWKTYRKEKIELLEVLRDGDKILWDMAYSQVQE